MILLNTFCRVASWFLVFTATGFAQEPVVFQLHIERDGDSSTSLSGTLIVNSVENNSVRTIRIPDSNGKLKDSVRFDKPSHEFTIDGRELFSNEQDVAKLDIFILSSRYMPQRYPATIRTGESELRIETWIQSKEVYREKADGNRFPMASKEIRRIAKFLDPDTHKEIVKQLEDEAKTEEELENRKAAATQTPLSLLLPAYIYPPDAGALADKTNKLAQLNAKDWQTIETDIAKLVRLGIECNIIVNPPIGPEVTVDRQYEAKISMLRRINARPIGYVKLGDGSGPARVYESPESVEQQINDWRRLYPQIDSFFFDTCPTDEESFANIDKITKSVKQRSPKAKIFINPGTLPHESYLTSKSIDVVCAFESNLEAASLAKFQVSNTNLAAILWNSKLKPENEIAVLRPLGFTCFYITDRNDNIDLDGVSGPDANLQWGRLPSLEVWKNLLNTLAKSKTIKK
jgi:hypothetical protein